MDSSATLRKALPGNEAFPFILSETDAIPLSIDGRIVDFIDPAVTRPNTPEERVRQVYARKLHYDYAYPKEHLLIGAPIAMGSEQKQADIVVYHDQLAAQRKDQSRIRLVVETKAPNVRTGQAQLTSYILASSAEGGVWVNLSDPPRYYRRPSGGSELLEWPNIPRHGAAWEDIGAHSKANLRTPHNLVETFKRCHNALYKVGIDSEDIAMDMVRIILAKYQDEVDAGETCEFRVTPLESQSAEGRRRVAQRVHSLFGRVRDSHRDVFEPHENITAGDREIATVVSELQDFRFLPNEESEALYDIVGAAYEVYVGSHLKGDRGQYFTHRLIVQLLVRLVDPTESDIVLDPAVGSGGFLIAAMRHVSHKVARSNRPQMAKRTALRNLYGHMFGIDKSPKLVKVARTNMILASDGHSGLIHADSLEPLSSLPGDFTLRCGIGIPTVILTNPPFGATSEHRISADKEGEILSQFDLGRVWKLDSDGELQPTSAFLTEGVPPEYLFVERCVRWVAPGGKIGIVVPRGVLDNDKALPLRTLLMRQTRVLAVVNCHDDTFKPHTDAKAALLVLAKRRPDDKDERPYPIFMAISQAIGHDGVGKPIYKADDRGELVLADGEPVLDHDSDDIYRSWLSLRAGGESGSQYYFVLSSDKVSDSLSLNPVRYLPQYTESRRRVLELGEQPGWSVERLGQIAQVFNGPRFKRPYADREFQPSSEIVRYFTGNAVTQTRGENIKYLDLRKARPVQMRMIDKLFLRRGMILVTDSGTVGRVVYATRYHDGAVGTNNLIRVVIEDEALRGYVYQFLSSELGQHQLKANIYGAIVDHIEPDEVKEVLVPIPEDRALLEQIGLLTIKSIELQEKAYERLCEASDLLSGCL